MANSDNVNRWVLKCIKRYGGPYEIPDKSKQSWAAMKTFLQSNIFDVKTSKSKVKGCVMQGLLSCCITLEDSMQIKDNIIAELQTALNEYQNKYDLLEKQYESCVADLRLHAQSLREALVEKSDQCDQLADENQRLNLQITDLQDNFECSRGSPELTNLPDNANSHNNPSQMQIMKPLPAAPTIVNTVYNGNGTTDVQIVTSCLRPDELDAFVTEVGIVPQHNLNVFLKWFCDLQRVKECYKLNQSDTERLLQKVVGNGLWARINHICAKPLRIQDILKELLIVLYGVQLAVSLYGKFKQMQHESPYEISYRIETVMNMLDCGPVPFEPGGEIHRTILLDSLGGPIKEAILFATPNPCNLNDILLRADHLWRTANKNCVKIDVASIFKPNIARNVQKQDGNSNYKSAMPQSHFHKPHQNSQIKPKTWIPFSKIKQEHDHLKIEYDKIKIERDKLKDEVFKLQAELQSLKVTV